MYKHFLLLALYGCCCFITTEVLLFLEFELLRARSCWFTFNQLRALKTNKQTNKQTPLAREADGTCATEVDLVVQKTPTAKYETAVLLAVSVRL